jgi:prefoldin subunit 5
MSDTKASGPSLTEAVETLRQRSARLRKVINRTPEDIALADSMDAVLKALADVTQEERDGSRLIQRQSDLLTGVVNALKGEPPSLTLWSHHDAPELARQAVAALAQREEDVTRLREWADAKIERMLARADEIAVVIAKTLHEVLDRLTRHQPSGAKEGA